MITCISFSENVTHVSGVCQTCFPMEFYNYLVESNPDGITRDLEDAVDGLMADQAIREMEEKEKMGERGSISLEEIMRGLGFPMKFESESESEPESDGLYNLPAVPC